MKTIILAGGYGTRLSEETSAIPKPMIDVGGRPLLWHIMKLFSSQGFNDFSIALGYKGGVIKRYFLHYPQIESDFNIDLHSGLIDTLSPAKEQWNVDLVNTGENTMTGGRLKRLQPFINGPIFFTYGDGLSNVDLKKLLAFHKSHGKLVTVTAVTPPQRFGVLKLHNNQVTAFNEKKSDSPLINGGYFVIEPEALDYIDDDTTSWEVEPCQRLVQDKQLVAYQHEGYWQCVDTLHELRLLRDIWDAGKAPWKIW